MAEIYPSIVYGSVTFLFLIFLLVIFYIFNNRYKKKIFFKKIFCNHQEIYNFGKIGLILVDNNDNILWVNEFLKKTKITNNQFKKALNISKFNNDDFIIIDFIKYKFELLKELNLYILKDIRELNDALTKLENNSIVLGSIVIDNCPNIINDDYYDDNLFDYLLKIKNIIFNYAKKFRFLVKKYYVNKYSIVCDFSALKDMQDDNFSLVDEVRKIFDKLEGIPLTLSIAFAHGDENIGNLSEAVENAMNVISNRGGDQVVVHEFGKELVFYKNRNNLILTEDEESKSKIRNFANSLIEEIKNATRIFVLSHKNTDLDALGSCLGVLKICQFFRKKCHIVYDDNSVELSTQKIFNFFLKNEISNITIKIKEFVEVQNNKNKPDILVVVVDCNNTSILLLEKNSLDNMKTILIDHHVLSNVNQISSILSYIEPSSASCTELITELISYLPFEIKIDHSYANVMLAGILIDSNFFNYPFTSQRTFETASYLIKLGADKNLIYNLLSDDLETNKLISNAILSLKEANNQKGIFYCVMNTKSASNISLAKIADKCIQIKNINAIFVISEMFNGEIYIIGRGNGEINIQLIAEKMGGGGKLTSSKVIIKNKTLAEAEKIFLENINNEKNYA